LSKQKTLSSSGSKDYLLALEYLLSQINID